MVHSFDGFNHLIRLDKGESVVGSLQKFIAEVKCEGAWLAGIGGVQAATLGFYNLETKEYKWQDFKGLYELTSLNGTIALNEQDEPVLHLHGTLSDGNYQTIGGHIKDLIAAGTIEIFVHRAYKPIHRKTDQSTGLKILDLP